MRHVETQPITRSRMDELQHVIQQLNLRCMRSVLKGIEIPAARKVVESEALFERLSSFPLLLVDLHFCEPTWWRAAITERQTGIPCLDARVLATFEVAMAVWRRAEPSALFQLSFGVSPAVCELLVKLSAHEIARVAYQVRPGIELRWGSDAAFWGDLLESVVSDDAELWRAMRVHALQLLGRDLSRASDS